MEVEGHERTPNRHWGLVRRWPYLFSVNPDEVNFYLYPNSDNEDYREKIDISNSTALAETSYNITRPLIILIHGLLASPSTVTDVINIKNAYLSVKQEANVVMVDHSALQDANLPPSIPFLNMIASYPANWNTFRIGKRVADFIKFIFNEKSISGLDQVHLIGMGSGAYIAGHAGETITNTLPGRPKIGRISGLDSPGGQLFPSLLDSSDAQFVDITYTTFGMTGMIGRTGHVDFYMNGGGFHQPNCRNAFPFTEPYCSHVSAVYYFAKSIRNKYMHACKCSDNCKKVPRDCNDKIHYGQYAPRSARGDYYVVVKNYM